MTLKLLHIFENLVNFFLFREYNLESDLVSSEPPVQHGPELPSATQWRNHTWSIVVNDQVALWTDQVALLSDLIKQFM